VFAAEEIEDHRFQPRLTGMQLQRPVLRRHKQQRPIFVFLVFVQQLPFSTTTYCPSPSVGSGARAVAFGSCATYMRRGLVVAYVGYGLQQCVRVGAARIECREAGLPRDLPRLATDTALTCLGFQKALAPASRRARITKMSGQGLPTGAVRMAYKRGRNARYREKCYGVPANFAVDYHLELVAYMKMSTGSASRIELVDGCVR